MELTQTQKKLLDVFKNSGLTGDFYWTGDTALSYKYLHHRLSFDLDFFSDRDFGFNKLEPFIDGVKKNFSVQTVPAVKIYDRWQFELKQPQPVKFEFV